MNSYRVVEQFDLCSSQLGVGCFQTSVGSGDFVTHLPQRRLLHSPHFDNALLMLQSASSAWSNYRILWQKQSNYIFGEQSDN